MAASAPARAPRPSVLASLGDSADGLLSAWLFRADKHPEPLQLGGVEEALARREGVVWVHLNATASAAKQWVLRCSHLPEPVREDLLETDKRMRLEPLGDAIVGVLGDVVAGADPDPWRLSNLHLYVDRHCLISARRRPNSCASKLARAVRGGLAVKTRSSHARCAAASR